MNTIFKKSFFAIASLFAMLFAGSSCVDTIGIQVTDEVPNADRTLYQVITTDETLTDFVEVYEQLFLYFVQHVEPYKNISLLFGESDISCLNVLPYFSLQSTFVWVDLFFRLDIQCFVDGQQCLPHLQEALLY